VRLANGELDAYGELLLETFSDEELRKESLWPDIHNRLVGFGYDAAGNMTSNGTDSYSYDAENRIVTFTGATSATYTYDGDGKRIKKSTGKMYWTGMGSDPLTETDLAGNPTADYIFFDGRRVARRDLPGGAVHYYLSDHLGSAHFITNATGGIQESSDYYPYGGERVIINGDPNQYKFTGKERDSESGVDYFETRHYASSLGRFMQPDEFPGGPVDLFNTDEPAPQTLPYADINDPQSLNKYAYTYNNPLRYVDPNGHDAWDIIKGAANAFGSDFFGGAGRQDSGNGDYKVGQAIGDFGATVVGAGETLLGAGGEVGGLALDATGVGAVAGVPVGVVSTAAVIQGSSAVLVGGANLLKAANESSGANTGEKPQGPVKAKDAPGVTAGNQATNEHAQKLAPSRKPQVNNVNKTTREAAKNAMRSSS